MAYSYAWPTAFDTPAAPTTLAVASDTDSISLDGTWDASLDTMHYEYLVEAQSGDDDWIEIGRTTSPSLVYYLAPLNLDVRVRVSDSNGSQYSATTEVLGNLAFRLWALTQVDGNEDFITPLLWAQEGATINVPLDQVVLQPLSGPDGDTQFPIVITGQWQGERIGITVLIPDDDQAVLNTVMRAAKEPSGSIAIKSPDGKVYLVQFGAPQLTKQDGFVLAAFSAIRVA